MRSVRDDSPHDFRHVGFRQQLHHGMTMRAENHNLSQFFGRRDVPPFQ